MLLTEAKNNFEALAYLDITELMMLTRTGKSTRIKHQINSTSSQTLALDENRESSVDPHLKHKIESCFEFVVSGIDSGEDTETLEEY